MQPHTSTSGHSSDRCWLTGLAGPLHLLDFRPRPRRMDVMLKHGLNNFKPSLGQLIYERFEFVTGRHDGQRIPCLSAMIMNITTR